MLWASQAARAAMLTAAAATLILWQTWAGAGIALSQEAPDPSCETILEAGEDIYEEAGPGTCSLVHYHMENEGETQVSVTVQSNSASLVLKDSEQRVRQRSNGTNPQSNATVPPGTAKLEFRPNGEPFVIEIRRWRVAAAGTINIHTGKPEPTAGDEVEVTLRVENPKDNVRAVATAWLELPPGLSVARTSAGHWADPRCATYCEARFTLEPGQRAQASAWVLAGEAGEREVRAGSVWTGDTPGSHRESMERTLVLAVREPPESEPKMTLHASRTQVREGENLSLTLTIANGPDKPPMEAVAVLELPEGTSITATGFADSCAGQCQSVHRVPPGGQRTVAIDMVANDPGEFAIRGDLAWSFPGHPEEKPGRNREYLVLNVDRPLQPQAEGRLRPNGPVRMEHGGVPGMVYAGAAGGMLLVALSMLVILLKRAMGKRATWKIRAVGTPHDPKVRSVAAIPVIAGVALVLSSVFAQPEGASAWDGLVQALPGAAVMGGMAMVYRFLDLRAAVVVSAAVTCWCIAHMAGQGGGDGTAAIWSATLLLTFMVVAAAICRVRQALTQNRPT